MRQSLGEVMNSAARTASEIASCLSTDRLDMAILRIGDLMDQTSYLVARWDARLPKKSKDNLFRAREQLRSSHEVLSGNAGAVLTLEDKARLAWVGRRVSEIFNEEYGAAVEAAEARNK